MLSFSYNNINVNRINMCKKNKSCNDTIHMLIRGFGIPGDAKSSEEFFQILGRGGDQYIPQEIGLGEPVRVQYSIENAKEMWAASGRDNPYGGILFKNKWMFGSSNWNKRDNSNDFELTIASKCICSDSDVNKLIYIAKKLFIWCNGIYGYAHHESKSIYTPGLDYKTCLGGITWINLFGKPYVDMFGRNIILTAPCKVEEFAENCFLLSTAEKPIRVNPELLEVQDNVENHLGKDAFCRKGEVPIFLTFEELRAGKDRPSTEGYRSPDLSGYLKDSGRNKEEGLIAVVNDDGTITTYKVEPK